MKVLGVNFFLKHSVYIAVHNTVSVIISVLHKIPQIQDICVNFPS